MALSTFQLNPLTPSSSSSYPSSSSSPSLYFLSHYLRNRYPYSSFKSVKFNCSSSSSSSPPTVPIDYEKTRVAYNSSKSRRKPRPSFYEQIQDKWSSRIASPRKHLPWEIQEPIIEAQEEIVVEEPVKPLPAAVESCSVSFVPLNRSISAPWLPVSKSSKPLNDSVAQTSTKSDERSESVNVLQKGSEENVRISVVEKSKFFGVKDVPNGKVVKSTVETNEIPLGLVENDDVLLANASCFISSNKIQIRNVEIGGDDNVRSIESQWKREKEVKSVDRWTKNKAEVTEKLIPELDLNKLKNFAQGLDEFNDNDTYGVSSNSNQFQSAEVGNDDDNGSSIRLPWKKEKEVKGIDRWTKSKTAMAEKLIPENELKRLKNVALRMVERIKVGEAGVTQALVDSIIDKWETDEVVKLKFEGISTLNMKRTHELLEKRTGGLVIWRSGGSIVLFRGMTYKLHCAQSYTNQKTDHSNISQSPNDIIKVVSQAKEVKDSFTPTETYIPSSARYLKDLSKEEIIDFNELNLLLDDLGPRFTDWSGREPLPVDADLLPPVVPGYRAPFRILPYGAKHCLKNKQMTRFRRLARIMPPHFALGRSRELQGLAKAIVKLWETSAVVKIAIKRGVLNTLNERMSEEIKRLTGGTLLSRNKDYIVFYRGNDFMPPAVTKVLKKRQKETELCQDDEELVRQRTSAFIDSNRIPSSSQGPLLAGTLAETMAATSQWRKEQSSEDVENMIKESALAKHASLVRYLQKKLALAKHKANKAEKALSKVQEHLDPSELPSDLETLSDEERFLFRKMGLTMKPFLLLGTRGIFDGTIENMHLHWKFRELVKIIVKGKNFAQVKHIAISLEAESGGVLVSVDKTTKGYTIIIYRGKNYQRPSAIRPKNLLSRRQALARSIELQRREALKHHIMDLEEQIELLECDLEGTKSSKNDDNYTLKSRFHGDISSKDDDYDDEEDNDSEEDEGEEAYLETYESDDEDSDAEDEEVQPCEN